MKTRSVLFGALCIATCAGAAGLLKAKVNVDIRSVSGQSQKCEMTGCTVFVEVKPKHNGCEASIDLEALTVAKNNTHITWKLVRSEMSDGNTYSFGSSDNAIGIVFVDTQSPPQPLNPQPDNFENDHANSKPQKSIWKSMKKTQQALHYAPVVMRTSQPPTQCETNDPTIFNDGG